jgi:hydrogenase small subunit
VSTPIPVLWITSGLGCDGDSIAMTSATNPTLEDLLREFLSAWLTLES